MWKVFESAIRYADNPTQENKFKIESAYDKVIKQRGIQWNITMGLYWIRPNTYINLDSKNREFIISEKILPEQFIKELNKFKNIPNGEQYIQLCALLLDKIKYGNMVIEILKNYLLWHMNKMFIGQHIRIIIQI